MECKTLREDEIQKEGDVMCQSSSSSSFGDSMCARDDDVDDAQSMLSNDYPLPESFCDTEFLGFPKKKTDDRWKRLTKPLSWRCKWLELKIKELQSQARWYEKEVQNYEMAQQFDLEKSKLEDFDGESIPFHDQRMKVFKRGRRKRVEDITSVAAYMSNHNIFSYAEKRMPIDLRARYLDTGRKATGKQDGIDDKCLISELDCSDDVVLAKLLCKIDEAQGKAIRMRKRVDQLSSMPQTIAHSHRDFTIQNGKQCDFVEDPLSRKQREATVQIGRQCISADHTEQPLIPHGQCFSNNSPISSKSLRFHPFLEDLQMDEPEMNDDEIVADDEQLDYFMKVMNEITDVPLEEADAAEEDPLPVTKKRHKA